jgi:serine/threonine protein kinase
VTACVYGTEWFISSEVLKSQLYTYASDFFSFSKTYHEAVASMALALSEMEEGAPKRGSRFVNFVCVTAAN